MQKITLDEYKRILCLNEVDMFSVSEPNSKQKEYVEKHYQDEELQEVIDNTLNFIKKLLIVLKNQTPIDEETISYKFELPLNSISKILNGSDTTADELFYLEGSENQKISTKLIQYLFSKQSYLFFSFLEDKITYKDYTLYIPVLNIIVPASKVLELSIPSNIKSLGTEFMSGNEAMKKMFIPSTITTSFARLLLRFV